MWERGKVIAAVLAAICCSALGDVAISQAMQQVGDTPGGLLAQLAALINVFALVGVLCHLTFLLVYLYALSREDLSFVLPLTALDYVLVSLFAVLWVGAEVDEARWAGTLLVAAGVAMIARS